jgi:RNA methyltransferase, TrmH family
MHDPGLTRAEERLVRALHARRRRAAHALFLAEGLRVAEDALDAGIVLRLAVVAPSLEDTPRGQSLRTRLERTTTVRHVAEGVLARLAPTETPQGVLLVAETPATALGDLAPAGRALVLVLDGVQDPGNFGTLVRAADAFAAAAVIALPGTVDPWNAKAVRAAAGSSFHVPIVQATHAEAGAWLKEAGFTILAADAAGTPVAGVARRARTALIVGNEGVGLTRAAAALADERVAVPIAGRAESLNVGVAGGILLYELTRSGAS